MCEDEEELVKLRRPMVDGNSCSYFISGIRLLSTCKVNLQLAVSELVQRIMRHAKENEIFSCLESVIQD